MKKIIFIVSMIVIIMSIACGPSKEAKKKTNETQKESKVEKKIETKELHILHAGSLSIPFKDMAEAFMKKYPEYKVLLEGHGSRTCARQIIDLERQADVMGSADSAVIRNLLIPDHADFCIDFTTNEMALMYNEKSKFANEITTDNWYEILLKPGVQYGHADPNADPCGYRAVLTCKLAEKFYKKENLFKNLIEDMPKKNIRPKETDLLAMLEAGELDYIFIYRSVAEQHNSKHVLLSDNVNLKSADLEDFYKTAEMKITGKKPGEWIVKKGAPMVYGITIPKNAKDPEGGAKFIEFLLGEEGQKIMKKNGQPEIIPPRVDMVDKLPALLKPFFVKKVTENK